MAFGEVEMFLILGMVGLLMKVVSVLINGGSGILDDGGGGV